MLGRPQPVHLHAGDFHASCALCPVHVCLQECKGLGVFSQAQALDYLGSKLTQRSKGGFERRRKSKVGLSLRTLHCSLQEAAFACMRRRIHHVNPR